MNVEFTIRRRDAGNNKIVDIVSGPNLLWETLFRESQDTTFIVRRTQDRDFEELKTQMEGETCSENL